jgi:hypothetical protein
MRENAVINALLIHGREELRKMYTPDCCIAATAIVIDVLDWANIDAKPLFCNVNVFNAAGKEFIREFGSVPKDDEGLALWQSRGCKWKAIAGNDGFERFGGHLIAIFSLAGVKLLMDLTLNQTNNSEFGIDLPVILQQSKDDFESGAKVKIMGANGCLLQYLALPERTEFMQAPDWIATQRRAPVVRALIRHAKRIEREMNVEAEVNADRDS